MQNHRSKKRIPLSQILPDFDGFDMLNEPRMEIYDRILTAALHGPLHSYVARREFSAALRELNATPVED
jgi:hypothetical protein